HRLGVGLGDEHLAMDADRRAAREFGLCDLRAAAPNETLLETLDRGARCFRRAERAEMATLLARPARAFGSRGRIPERRMRALQRPQLHRHVAIGKILACVIEPVMGQPLTQRGIGIEKDAARFLVADIVVIELEWRDAAPDSDLQPAMGEM